MEGREVRDLEVNKERENGTKGERELVLAPKYFLLIGFVKKIQHSADPVGMGPTICIPYWPDRSNCTDDTVAKTIYEHEEFITVAQNIFKTETMLYKSANTTGKTKLNYIFKLQTKIKIKIA